MPMNVFINALVDGDLSEVENFELIFEDYCECIGGKEVVLSLRNLKEIVQLRNRIKLAENIIEQFNIPATTQIQIQAKAEIFDVLKGLNYHYMVPAPAFDNVEKYIEQIIPFIKREVLDVLKMERDRKPKEEGGEDKKYSRDYFADLFMEFLIVFKVHVTETISVREFCRLVVKYKNYCEQQNKLNQAA